MATAIETEKVDTGKGTERNIGRVVQRADLYQRLDQTVYEGHLVPVAGHEDEFRVVVTGRGQMFLGLTQQGAGVIKEHHPPVATIFVG